MVDEWLQRCALADSSVSWNGRPILPVMPTPNWNHVGPRVLQDAVSRDVRSENRLKIFSGTANEPLSQVFIANLVMAEALGGVLSWSSFAAAAADYGQVHLKQLYWQGNVSMCPCDRSESVLQQGMSFSVILEATDLSLAYQVCIDIMTITGKGGLKTSCLLCICHCRRQLVTWVLIWERLPSSALRMVRSMYSYKKVFEVAMCF